MTPKPAARKLDLMADEAAWDALQLPDITKAKMVVLSDGRTGSENRSIGLAEMLGFKDPEVVTMRPKYTNALLRMLPVRWLYNDYARFEADMRAMDLVIGSGYQVSRILRALKKAEPRLFTVALMRPSGGPKEYDVVAVEQHDAYSSSDNVVVTLGATNRITRDRLAQEGDRWKRRLAHVRGMRLAVMIGGDSKHAPFDVAEVKKLVAALKRAMGDNGGLLVSTSRRTSAPIREALQAELEKSGLQYYLWQPEDVTARDNPYLAYLALADGIVVTADSVSMVSEAASAGKPVYLWGDIKGVPRKFRALYDALAKQGRVRWWNGLLTLRAPAAGLMDTMMVAGFVRARWNKRMMH